MEPVGATHAPALRVTVGGRRYAAALRDIGELVRVPTLAPVPLGPACLIGLMSHRGAALPVVDAAVLLDAEPRAATARSRVLVGTMGLGFLVDQVEGGETPGADRQGGDPALDLAALIRDRLPLSHPPRPAAAAGGGTRRGGQPPAEATHALLGFTVGGREYAFALEAVAAVVRIRQEAAAAGTAAWRGLALPLVFLAAALGDPEGGARPVLRVPLLHVAVVRLPGGGVAGAVVDHFNGILRVPAAQCHPVPPLLARGRAADVQSICRLDGGARLVCVLSPEHVLQAGADGQAPQPLAREASGRHEARLAGRRTAGDRPVRFIVYRVGQARFAAAMPSIDEVLRAGAGLTPVPGGPPAVAGMMHHRGAALPVIDLRRQFGLPGGAAGKAKILVHAVRGSSGEAAAAGFMVDAVEGVVAAASGGIAVPPALPAASAALVTHILDSPDGTAPLPVLDLRRLLDGAAGSLPALLEGLLPSPAAQAEARAMLH